jgi:hypothetical protein
VSAQEQVPKLWHNVNRGEGAFNLYNLAGVDRSAHLARS